MKLTNKQDSFKFQISPQTMFKLADHQKALEDKVKQLEKENHELSLKYGAAVSEIDALKKKRDMFKELYERYVDRFTSTVGNRNILLKKLKEIREELYWGDAENAIDRVVKNIIDPIIQKNEE